MDDATHFTESMRRIAHWLDREEDALEYTPDCGMPASTPPITCELVLELTARRYHEVWFANTLFPLHILNTPMLDASED